MESAVMDNAHTTTSTTYFNPYHCSEKHAMIFQGSPELRHQECGHPHCHQQQQQWIPVGNAPSYASQRVNNSQQAVPTYRQDCQAMSMTTQPFIPKEVTDIARPVPMNKQSTQKREQSMPGSTQCRCGCCNEAPPAQFVEHPCFFNMSTSASRAAPENLQRSNSNAYQSSSNVMPPAQINSIKTCCNPEPMGSNMIETDFQQINGASNSRSRSQWRSNDTTAGNNVCNGSKQSMTGNVASPMKPGTMYQHQVFPMQNQAGHCHCMNPNCPVHQPQTHCFAMDNLGCGIEHSHAHHGGMFQRSRSYEVLDGMMNGFNQMNLNGTAKKKASLPPASHHSPEQRTSYRDQSRP